MVKEIPRWGTGKKGILQPQPFLPKKKPFYLYPLPLPLLTKKKRPLLTPKGSPLLTSKLRYGKEGMKKYSFGVRGFPFGVKRVRVRGMVKRDPVGTKGYSFALLFFFLVKRETPYSYPLYPLYPFYLKGAKGQRG